jgi:hypothetical protein
MLTVEEQTKLLPFLVVPSDVYHERINDYVYFEEWCLLGCYAVWLL